MEVSLSKRKIIFGSIRTIHSVTALNVVAQTTILRDNPGMATNETHTIAGQTFSLGRTVTDSYDFYWGRDLSGTFHDAGGIGGLLAYTYNGALRIPIYDHIGNVVAVVDDTGSTIATYEYDPFGNIVAKSGPEADEAPFRFSTKYFDAETGLHYYGYRFYASTLGRWLNRDPMEEYGGENLYAYVLNNGLIRVDSYGLFGNCYALGTPRASHGLDWELWKIVPDIAPLSATISPSAAYLVILRGIDVVWRLQGTVQCCCSFGIWRFTKKWTSTRNCYKTFEGRVSFDQEGFRVYPSPTQSLPTPMPNVSTMSSALGEYLAADIADNLPVWLSISHAELENIRGLIDETKPRLKSQGVWPNDPCKR